MHAGQRESGRIVIKVTPRQWRFGRYSLQRERD
jgi:hypothetical protein